MSHKRQCPRCDARVADISSHQKSASCQATWAEKRLKNRGLEVAPHRPRHAFDRTGLPYETAQTSYRKPGKYGEQIWMPSLFARLVRAWPWRDVAGKAEAFLLGVPDHANVFDDEVAFKRFVALLQDPDLGAHNQAALRVVLDEQDRKPIDYSLGWEHRRKAEREREQALVDFARHAVNGGKPYEPTWSDHLFTAVAFRSG